MGEHHCPGLPADWLNGWLAAIGATVLVDGMTLRWSNDPVPVAVLDHHDVDPAAALNGALPTIDQVNALPVARNYEGCEPVGLNLSFKQFRQRAQIARTHELGWALSSFYTDALTEKTNPKVDRGAFLPPMPGKANTIQDRMLKLVAAAADADVNRSLDGVGERAQQFGLGFDPTRIGSLADNTNMWVDPIIELLAFAGLSLFPTRGDGYETARQRGWSGRKLGVGSFQWPTWTAPLTAESIDAFLDVYWTNPAAAARLGLSSEWEVVPHEGTATSDVTRGLASARVTRQAVNGRAYGR